MKVMTIVGTRPEIIKLSRVIAVLDQHTEHVFVHTGQNYDYELNEIFFKDLEIRKPDHFLNAAAETPMQTIATILAESDKLMEKVKPDALLLYGDTNSCLSVMAAKRRKIPVFHMEAGNRCFDERVPEELNRKVVDHLSDINMPLSEHARQYLLSEGIPAERIIKTGSCMKEVLNHYMPKIEKSKILNELQVKPKDYVVVSLHREENVDDAENLKNVLVAIQRIQTEFKNRFDFYSSAHAKKLDAIGYKSDNANVRFLKPFGFCDYIQLQKNAFCVVSDSGTITEESSLLKIPAVTVRNAHERPEGMDMGTLIMSGTEPEDIVNSIKVATSLNTSDLIGDYDVTHVADQVLKLF